MWAVQPQALLQELTVAALVPVVQPAAVAPRISVQAAEAIPATLAPGLLSVQVVAGPVITVTRFPAAWVVILTVPTVLRTTAGALVM